LLQNLKPQIRKIQIFVSDFANFWFQILKQKSRQSWLRVSWKQLETAENS